MPMFDPRIDQAGAQSLADLMGGGSAAQYLGGQQAMIEQMNPINKDLSLADLDKIQLANQHDRTMNPMKEQVQRSLVREADSKTPEYYTGMRQGELGTARSQVAKAKLDEGTLDSNVSAKNSENQTKLLNDMGNNMLQVVAFVGGISDPIERQRAMRQLITSHGWDKNPQTHSIWENLVKHPDMLLEATNMAERMRDFNPKYLEEQTKIQMQGDNALDVANAQGRWHLAAANARVKDTNEMFKKEWMKLDDARKASVLDTLISEAKAFKQAGVELPNGMKLPIAEAEALAKQLSLRAISRTPGNPQVQIPGIDRTDPRSTVIQNLYPSSNIPLADPLGIRK